MQIITGNSMRIKNNPCNPSIIEVPAYWPSASAISLIICPEITLPPIRNPEHKKKMIAKIGMYSLFIFISTSNLEILELRY